MAKGIAMGILSSCTKVIAMEGNLLLEQFSRYKKIELEDSPFHFLLDANIERNPHQVNAFCAAIQALKTGGIVLADEVGLGKTIEAGLVLKYVLDSGAKRVLIALPLPSGNSGNLNLKRNSDWDQRFSTESSSKRIPPAGATDSMTGKRRRSF